MKNVKRFLISCFILLTLSTMYTHAQGHLDVEGQISATSLTGADDRLLMVDSNGTIKVKPDGSPCVIYDMNGNPRLVMKPDSSIIEQLNKDSSAGMRLYFVDSIVTSFHDPSNRAIPDFDLDHRLEIWSETSNLELFEDRNTSSMCRQIREISTGQQEAFMKLDADNPFIGRGTFEVNFPGVNNPSQRSGIIFQSEGSTLYNDDPSKIGQSTAEGVSFLDFTNNQNFRTHSYGIFGIDFTEFINGVLNTVSIALGDTFAVDVQANNANFSGNINAIGTKNFRIDHPHNPGTQFLYHAAVESPMPYNLYRGSCTTDQDGIAVVSLPSYFSDINTEFTYHLTAINSFSRLKVMEEIQGNQFTIASENAAVEVNWMVIGTRDDAYMRAHPFQTIKNKSEHDRNKATKDRIFHEQKILDMQQKLQRE